MAPDTYRISSRRHGWSLPRIHVVSILLAVWAGSALRVGAALARGETDGLPLFLAWLAVLLVPVMLFRELRS